MNDAVLATVREGRMPDVWVGAGTIRDLVWGTLYAHGFDPATVHDIDMDFYGPAGLDWKRNDAATTLLAALWPEQP